MREYTRSQIQLIIRSIIIVLGLGLIIVLFSWRLVKIPRFPTTGGLPSVLLLDSEHIPDFSQDTTKVKATSTKSGNWSDPTVWSTGAVPAANQIAVIPAGQTITYDSANGTAYTISVHGSLKFRTDIPTKLTVTNLEVMRDGYLEIGTTSTPIASNVQAEIVIADTPINTADDPAQWGTGFLSFGKVRINGSVKNSTFVKLASEPLAGQTTLSLSAAPTGWKAGDVLTLPDSRQWPRNDSGFVPQDEQLTIQAISGTTITLASPLQFKHPAGRDGNSVIKFYPYVGNLTRNVLIHSANAAGTRGHVAMIHTADSDIRYAEFKDLGRTTTDLLNDGSYDSSGNGTHIGTNQRGKYALHIHHVIGPVSTQPDGYQYTLVGNSVNMGPSNQIEKWGITLHDSSYGWIKDNVIYNAAGAGIMQEDGNEVNNVIEHNFVVRVPGTGQREDERLSNHEFGMEGAGIWLSNPMNYVRDNVVSGSRSYAYALFTISDAPKIPNFPGADTTVATQVHTVSMKIQPILEFARNEGYASSNGMTIWDIGAACCSGAFDAPESVIKDQKLWNISSNGLYGYGMSHVTFDNWTQLGDKAVLNNHNNWPTGLFFSDYITRNLKVINSDFENLGTGIFIPIKSGDVRDAFGNTATPNILENTYLRNVVNIFIAFPWGVTGGGSAIPPRQTIVNKVQFAQVLGPVDGFPQYNIKMAPSGDAGGPNFNYIQSDQVFVYDYNKVSGNNFQVFRPEQAPGFIVPKAGISENNTGSPEAGLTNQQNWAKYGIAMSGAIATCSDSATHPEIFGFVCPLGSVVVPPPSPTPTPTPPPADTTPPQVTAFDIQPRTGTGSLTATFSTTDAGGSFLSSAHLWKATFNSTNCSAANNSISGCVWSDVQSTNAPSSSNSWVSSMVNSPSAGSYLFGLHSIDRTGNEGVEPALLQVTVNAVAQPPPPPPTPTPTPTPLPTPWLAQDIGNVGFTGATTSSNGLFTVTASGNDIWDIADAFRYSYQPMSGDGQIVARVVSVQNSDAWTKAGVMIRQDLTPGSPNAAMIVSPSNGLSFQRRTTTGGISTYSPGTGSAPLWVKLVRTGSSVTGYTSLDNVTWTLVGTDTITFPGTVFVGLAVTSHNNSLSATATFDNVAFSTAPVIVPPPPPPVPTPTPTPTPPPPPASTTYQASLDFHAVGGLNNWTYLQSNNIPMTFISSIDSWRGSDSNTLLRSNGGSPGSKADVIRRFTVPSTGSVRITGSASRTTTSCGGDGVLVTIKKNTTTLFSQIIRNATVYRYDLTSKVNRNDKLDFVINRRNNNTCDSTTFDPTIVLTAVSPAVSFPLTGSNTSSVPWIIIIPAAILIVLLLFYLFSRKTK